MPAFSERQDLAKRFAADVARMRRCLEKAGNQVEDDDTVYAWTNYSDTLCAGWLMLPEKDDALLAILLKHLPPIGQCWHVTIVDAGDGSGDCVLPLPEDLLAHMNWKESDMLRVNVEESAKLIVERG